MSFCISCISCNGSRRTFVRPPDPEEAQQRPLLRTRSAGWASSVIVPDWATKTSASAEPDLTKKYQRRLDLVFVRSGSGQDAFAAVTIGSRRSSQIRQILSFPIIGSGGALRWPPSNP